MAGGLNAIEAAGVGLVVAKQQFVRALAEDGEAAEHRIGDTDAVGADRRQRRFHRVLFPRPGIAEPDVRQNVQRRVGRPAIGDRHLHQDVVHVGFGVGDLDVEIVVVVEHAGVEQLELGRIEPAPGVLLDQPLVGKGVLRILVEHTEKGMRRRRIEEVV